MMPRIRSRTLAIVLISSLIGMFVTAGGPLVAGTPHEVCDKTDHGCVRIAPDSCCCGNPADTSPSQVPSDRADTVCSPHVPVAVVALVAPPMAALISRDGLPSLARPPDLWVLFRDFRI